MVSVAEHKEYQQSERVGVHSPDGFNGQNCASCSARLEKPVKWPCAGARYIRKMQRGSE
jgi:hypothetical protein